MQNITDVLDIKVGYACNNNCLHCVVKTNQYIARKQDCDENFSFQEIERLVKSKPRDSVMKIVITGGEPSIRNDFPEIINMIFDCHPNITVEIQTNGRGLKKHLPKIYHHEKLFFTIALHGANEKMHNAVVGTATANRNPFKETTESIEEVIRLYGDAKRIAFKVVLNSINFKYLQSIVSFLVEKYQADNIAVAYPHLDGFYFTKESMIDDFKLFCHPLLAKSDLKSGADFSKKIGFSYAEFSNSLKSAIEYIGTRPNVNFQMEAVPLCAFNKNGEHYEIPSNVFINNNVAANSEIHYTNSDISDFHSLWENMHKHPEEICSKCKKCCSCCGIWEETYAVFGTDGLNPYTE